MNTYAFSLAEKISWKIDSAESGVLSLLCLASLILYVRRKHM